LTAKRGRGRPAYKPTDENRAEVQALTAAGIKREAIAHMLEINIDTLEKYYRQELETGKDVIRGKLALALHKKGMEGNVAAIKAFLAMSDKDTAIREAEEASRSLIGDAEPAAPPPKYIGKKEQALTDAKSIIEADDLLNPHSLPEATTLQ
jgi:hypothetical protein